MDVQNETIEVKPKFIWQEFPSFFNYKSWLYFI